MEETGLTPILRQLHRPHDPKVVHMAALPRLRIPEAVSHHIHGKRPVHVSAKMGIVPTMVWIHPEFLEDAVDTERGVVLQEQIALPIEQDDIEVAGEAWPWHAFWRLDRQEGAVIIGDMQPSAGSTLLAECPQRKLAH